MRAQKYTAAVMPVLISMLRGVNVVGRNQIKMEALRAVYKSLKFEDPRTFIQSGNVIFRTRQKNSPVLAKKIQDAIEDAFGFRPAVIVRTPDELRRAIAATPFPSHRNLHPSKILVTFLSGEPGPEASHAARTEGVSGRGASERTRALYLFSQRRWPDEASVVRRREIVEGYRYRPQLEQRHQDAGDRGRDGEGRVSLFWWRADV